MKNSRCRGRVALFGFLVLAVLAGLAAVQTPVWAQNGIDPTLPDLVPMGFGNEVVSRLLGGPTLEFDILTANIGGQDYIRPCRDGALVMPQIYEYTLYVYSEDVGDYVQIDQRRKTTICTIDDGSRGNVFPCLQEHGVRFGCARRCPGGIVQEGVSRGWADSYFRGLTGQWVFIGDSTGQFLLNAHLDPDVELTGDDLPASGQDATHDDNYFDVYFTYNGGSTITDVDVVYYFDRDNVCPPDKE